MALTDALRRTQASVAILVGACLIAGCGPRVLIATGTTLGLKATPGDGQSRPPQVTLGYKRAEAALIPTSGGKATRTSPPTADNTDAFSTLAAFDFESVWFGKTELSSFIATGFAAKYIQGEAFQQKFAAATLNDVPGDLQTRRVALHDKWKSLTEAQATSVLGFAGFNTDTGKTAKESLQDRILHATTDTDVKNLEAAFGRLS